MLLEFEQELRLLEFEEERGEVVKLESLGFGEEVWSWKP